MKFLCLIVATAFCCTTAWSDPIYLDCKLPRDRGDFRVQLMIDEASGRISHTQDNGFAFNTEGFFTANTITYQKVDVIGGALKIVLVHQINRSTLEYSRVMQAELYDPKAPAASESAEDKAERGRCEVVTTTKRQI